MVSVSPNHEKEMAIDLRKNGVGRTCTELEKLYGCFY